MKKDELRALFAEIWPRDPRMVDYCVATTASTCTLSNGMILTARKLRIQNRFCFGYSDCGQGPEYSEAFAKVRNAQNESYFMEENLKPYEQQIERIDANDVFFYLSPVYGPTSPVWELSFRFSRWDFADLVDTEKCKPGTFVETHRGGMIYIPTDDDMKRIRAMFAEAKKAHEKKCRSYLKRYGTSKVKAWTYWLDD